MKAKLTALVALMVAPFATAQADVSISPIIGYHYYSSSIAQSLAKNKYKLDNKVAEKAKIGPGLFLGAAVGYEFMPDMPNLTAQGEIQYSFAKFYKDEKDTKNSMAISHLMLNANVLYTLDQQMDLVHPYGLVGLGYSYLNSSDSSQSTPSNPPAASNAPDQAKEEKNDKKYSPHSAVFNVGGGGLWDITDSLTLRTELRGVYNFSAGFSLQVGVGAVFDLGKAQNMMKASEPQEPSVQSTTGVVENAVNTVKDAAESVGDAMSNAKESIKQMVEELEDNVNVYFGSGKANPDSEYIDHELTKIAQFLYDVPNATAEIYAYADYSTGSVDANDKLALKRANAVKKLLTEQFGIDADRITVNADVHNGGDTDAAMNRRVEVIVKGTVTKEADH